MGILFGFAPWIVYWVLVGNVPFTTAVLVALAIAVLSFVIGRIRGAPGRTLEIGAVGTFLVLSVLTFTLSQSFMEQWMQPLSNAGIFLVAFVGLLVGRPFVREFAEVGQPPEVVESELFARITTLLTWIWVAAFAGMTVSAVIPPIVYGDATILDTKTPLSFVCYWVIPFSLLLSRDIKRNKKRLIRVCQWIIFAKFFDLFWLIEPNFKDAARNLHFSWGILEYVAVPAAMVSLWVAYFCTQLKTRPLVQTNDPHVAEILESEHVHA